MIIETNYNEDRITTTTQNIHVKDTSIIIVDSNMNSWLKVQDRTCRISSYTIITSKTAMSSGPLDTLEKALFLIVMRSLPGNTSLPVDRASWVWCPGLVPLWSCLGVLRAEPKDTAASCMFGRTVSIALCCEAYAISRIARKEKTNC